MTEKTPAKDEALEALDFIVNVLKEHEKDLDRLINELGNVAGQLGETGELNGKVKKIEDKINGIQKEIKNLKSLAMSQESPVVSADIKVADSDKTKNQITPTSTTQPNSTGNMNPVVNQNHVLSQQEADLISSELPLTLHVSQWEDFQALSNQAQTISFKLKENEKIIEITAIKNNQIITYTGQTSNQATLIKTWVSKQLNIAEEQIIEGNIIPR
jgi:hypothetical protein